MSDQPAPAEQTQAAPPVQPAPPVASADVFADQLGLPPLVPAPETPVAIPEPVLITPLEPVTAEQIESASMPQIPAAVDPVATETSVYTGGDEYSEDATAAIVASVDPAYELAIELLEKACMAMLDANEKHMAAKLAIRESMRHGGRFTHRDDLAPNFALRARRNTRLRALAADVGTALRDF